MSVSTLIIAILDALVAIPKIADMVMGAVSAVVGWWVTKQTNDTLSAISHAAALAARAQTDEQRYEAAAAWQKALSRPRISAS